jgi:hypothetical protein
VITAVVIAVGQGAAYYFLVVQGDYQIVKATPTMKAEKMKNPATDNDDVEVMHKNPIIPGRQDGLDGLDGLDDLDMGAKDAAEHKPQTMQEFI